jgi:hypothetical protein
MYLWLMTWNSAAAASDANDYPGPMPVFSWTNIPSSMTTAPMVRSALDDDLDIAGVVDALAWETRRLRGHPAGRGALRGRGAF